MGLEALNKPADLYIPGTAGKPVQVTEATREQLYESLRLEVEENRRQALKLEQALEREKGANEALKNTLAVVEYLERQQRALIVEVDRKEDDCLEYEGILSCMSREQVAAAEAAWEKKQSVEG